MHELSIATSILDFVLEEKKNKNWHHVNAIGLRIGALSGIMVEALEFSFDAIKKETLLENTVLEISEIPVSGICRNCSEKFSVTDLIFACPACHSTSIEVDKGQELDIEYLDIEDEAEIINER
jgi:hydrogenase nickel incorporation protein HypA/HybF